MASDSPNALRASLASVQAEFLQSVAELRPRLHRFCARMCGSVVDGEDVVQETLAQAFFRLPSLQEPSRLEPWLFRIAHHRCIDFLHGVRREREDAVPYDEGDHAAGEPDAAGEPPNESIGETLAPLLGALPPKERAAVLLKDLLDYRLEEVADVIDSTVGGVKAALHRGRAKLRALAAAPAPAPLDAHQRSLLDAYVECFNRRDWTALHRLIAVDARLEVVGVLDAKLREAGTLYFGNYAALAWEWRISLARVDGEPLVVLWRNTGAEWHPHGAVRLWWQGDQVVRIRDYFHVDYLLSEARIETI